MVVLVEVLAAWVLAVVAKAAHGELILLVLEQHPPQVEQMERMERQEIMEVAMAVEAVAAITAVEPTAVMAECQVEAEAEQVAVMLATDQ